MAFRGKLCWLLGHLRDKRGAWTDSQGWHSNCLHCAVPMQRSRDRDRTWRVKR